MAVNCKSCQSYSSNLGIPWSIKWVVWFALAYWTTLIVLINVLHVALPGQVQIGLVMIAMVSGVVGGVVTVLFYIPFNIIGHSAFWFSDSRGERHRHLYRPMHRDNRWAYELGETIDGPILEVPVAGWFRRCRIFNNGDLRSQLTNWHIVTGKDNLVRIRDNDGNELGLNPHEILSFNAVGACYAGIKHLLPPVSALKGSLGWDRIIRDRSELSRGVQGVLHYLRETKDAQKSKIGQHTRELLEVLIERVPGCECPNENAPDHLLQLRSQLSVKKERMQTSDPLPVRPQYVGGEETN